VAGKLRSYILQENKDGVNGISQGKNIKVDKAGVDALLEEAAGWLKERKAEKAERMLQTYNQILEAGRKKRMPEEMAKDMSPRSKKFLIDTATKEVARLMAKKMMYDRNEEKAWHPWGTWSFGPTLQKNQQPQIPSSGLKKTPNHPHSFVL
jgi:hypothetical protein